MLGEVLDVLNVPKTFWATLVGSSQAQLDEWSAGQREVPLSVAERLSKAIGVPRAVLANRKPLREEATGLLPPLWLKARERQLGESEHEAIAVCRLIASRFDEVLSLTEAVAYTYRMLFAEVKQNVDPQLPARQQGRVAADVFLRLSTLDKGATGIGEVFRGFLRARGLLLFETPIDSASFEGFCLPVGVESRTRPCLLANSYKTTWFRRNYVLLHELAHAIFDLEAANAVFDVTAPPALAGPTPLRDVSEQRADSFALHALVSKRVLTAAHSRGLGWSQLDAPAMAELVAQVHAEQSLVIRAAREYDLVDDEVAARLQQLKIAADLRVVSPHARGLAALTGDEIRDPEVLRWRDRLTTHPFRGIRLPIPYVRAVLGALANGVISHSRAAELLMVTRQDLYDRYGVEPEPDRAVA